MCGIFGIINKKLEKDIALKCLNELQHRGPDGSGLWQNGGTTLGHRRLSILDLSSNGSQPMQSENERYWITFNGEIYNFVEIRDELIEKGYSFKSDSDTEVILAAFSEWEEACVDKFNGMWAFAIWDNMEKKAFLCRDRYGVKPLFYIWLPMGGFAFASEMKALMPLLSQVSPNIEQIEKYKAKLHYEMEEDCIINGIKRFPAGYYAWVNEQKLELFRWWNTLDHLIDVPPLYSDQVECLRELFVDACKLRMRSDVTLGTALSGGLDSSATICAMADIARKHIDKRANQDWQHAYVACFPGTSLDESMYAKMVTDHLKIDSTFLNITEAVSERELYRELYLFEELYSNMPTPMMKIYQMEKEMGTTVSIDGHGADELFGGYPFDLIKAYPDTHANGEEINSITKAYLDMFNDGDISVGSKEFKKNRKHLYNDRMIRYYGKKLLGKPTVRSRDAGHPLWNHLDELTKTLYVSTHETILPSLLRNYDRFSMASGVEIRMPFMDWRIVQLAFSIGWNSKIKNGYSKAIIRDAVSPYMPHEIAYRKGKIGFNAPILEWIRGTYKEMFCDMVNSSEFYHCELIKDPKGIKKRLEAVIADKHSTFQAASEVWDSIQLYLWYQAVIKGKGVL